MDQERQHGRCFRQVEGGEDDAADRQAIEGDLLRLASPGMGDGDPLRVAIEAHHQLLETIREIRERLGAARIRSAGSRQLFEGALAVAREVQREDHVRRSDTVQHHTADRLRMTPHVGNGRPRTV